MKMRYKTGIRKQESDMKKERQNKLNAKYTDKIHEQGNRQAN